MAGLSAITVDLARGEIVFGARRVVLADEPAAQTEAVLGAGGSPITRATPRFRLPDGTIVRAIAFGERSRLVRDAMADHDPPAQLVTLLRAAALDGPSSTLSDAVLLALAGGAEEAPAFERCALDAARLRGWSWLSVHDTPAIVVDRAIERPDPPEASGEWNRFVFAAADVREIDELLHEMSARLLGRGLPPAGQPSLPERVDDGAASSAESLPRPAGVSGASARARAPREDVPTANDADVARHAGRPLSNAVPASRRAETTVPPPAEDSVSPNQRSQRRSQRAFRRALPPLGGEARGPRPSESAAPRPGTGAAHASDTTSATSLASRPGRTGTRDAAWPASPAAAAAAWPATPSAGAASSSAFPPAFGASPGPAVGRDVPGSFVSPTGHASLAFAMQAAPVFREMSARTPSATAPKGAPPGACLVSVAGLPASADLLDELAQALAAECDLRGVDA